MKYINSTLLKNEKIIYWTRPHWVIFGGMVLGFVIALLFLWYGPALGLAGFRLVNFELYEIAAFFSAVIGIFSGIKALISYLTTEYGITDKRVVMKIGWIRRNALEIFLDKVEAVRVDQSVIGRILDYGAIGIVGTGGTVDPYYNVPNPLGFRRKTQQQVDIYLAEMGRES